MLRLNPGKIILLGCGLILCGVALALDGQPTVQAQPAQQDGAEYVGSQACASCHRELTNAHSASRHALALQDVETDKAAIRADFTTGQKERTVTFPGESTPRPFTADDIAYVVGSGRYVERYLYKVERNKYAVFPAEWNVAKKAWEPYIKGKVWPDPTYDWTENCAGCHTTGLGSRGRFKDAGVQCEACHGPGSIHAERADKIGESPSDADLAEVRAAIVLSPDAQICGQCHSQGTEPENKLPYPVKYRPGTDLLSSGTFALAAPDSTDHWWASGHGKLDNMQFNEWSKSGHAKALTDLKASQNPGSTCLTCHSANVSFANKLAEAQKAGTRKGSPPPPVTVQSAQFGVTCTSCHNSHGDSKIDFNLTQEPYALCTSCHNDTNVATGLHHPVQEMFEGKQIVKEVPGVPSVHFTDKNGPKCTTCHLPKVPVESSLTLTSHLLKPILPGASLNTEALKDSCTTCHKDTTPEKMLKFITDSQLDTTERLRIDYAALKAGSPAWVKTALDFVKGDGSKGIHNHRYTATLLNAVEVELGIIQVNKPGLPSDKPMLNPAECSECHQKEYQTWVTSPHAKASLNEQFRKEFAAQKQPAFCLGCHASGYDPKTGAYVFEGIVCSNCHTTANGAKHPPAAVQIASEASSCGNCHSGAHAPTYDEWLISRHNTSGIDCVDCHTPHNNGLKQGDVNSTCGNCHKDATTDKVHMGTNMTCVDCHMKREEDAQGVFVIKTGHSMSIDPSVCASCHGKTHVLAGKGPGSTAAQESEKVTALQKQVAELQNVAQTNWASGIAGGAVGMLIVSIIGLLILRRGKFL